MSLFGLSSAAAAAEGSEKGGARWLVGRRRGGPSVGTNSLSPSPSLSLSLPFALLHLQGCPASSPSSPCERPAAFAPCGTAFSPSGGLGEREEAENWRREERREEKRTARSAPLVTGQSVTLTQQYPREGIRKKRDRIRLLMVPSNTVMTFGKRSMFTTHATWRPIHWSSYPTRIWS